MKHLLLALTLLTTSSTCLMAQSRHVTLTINSEPPRAAAVTNSYSLGPNETAEVVSWVNNGGYYGLLDVEKDNSVFTSGSGSFSSPAGTDGILSKGLAISGPAMLHLRSYNTNTKCFVTFKITPDAFPPDKTFIIPDGTPGATVTLECSTNLLTWTTATNGFYTGTNGAKFFRINAQRAQ